MSQNLFGGCGHREITKNNEPLDQDSNPELGEAVLTIRLQFSVMQDL